MSACCVTLHWQAVSEGTYYIQNSTVQLSLADFKSFPSKAVYVHTSGSSMFFVVLLNRLSNEMRVEIRTPLLMKHLLLSCGLHKKCVLAYTFLLSASTNVTTFSWWAYKASLMNNRHLLISRIHRSNTYKPGRRLWPTATVTDESVKWRVTHASFTLHCKISTWTTTLTKHCIHYTTTRPPGASVCCWRCLAHWPGLASVPWLPIPRSGRLQQQR